MNTRTTADEIPEFKTRQEVIDYVYGKLKDQKWPSRKTLSGEDFCAYRGTEGRKCAIGHLIPNSLYRKSMEKKMAWEVLDAVAIPDELKLGLCTQLQRAHDIWQGGTETLYSAFVSMGVSPSEK